MKTFCLRLSTLLFFLFVTACSETATPTPSPTYTPDPGVLTQNTTAANLPAVATRAAQVQTALAQDIPILTLSAVLDDHQKLAQDLALRDPRFQQNLRDPSTGQPLRSEVFGIYPARDSDYTDATAACRQSKCYRVEMYNYPLNLTTVAIVDVNNRAVLAVNQVQQSQPDIPTALKDLALQIATNAPEVIQELGNKPSPDNATMSNTKTALNRTLCERSRHLCVAPTFVVGSRALWAIVDLTDNKLVGVRWTNLGESSGHPVTEKELQDDVVSAHFCENNTPLSRDGWQLNYILTSSDGLRVSDVQFQTKPVLKSAKLVDWQVSYSGPDGFGYSDAVGCPAFSQAAVLAYGPPQVEDLKEGDSVVGFVLLQKFQSELWPLPCNYNYEQRYEFYKDGRFRIVVGSLGRGCGDNGMYRPVIRIAPAGPYTFSQWNGTSWQDWTTEQWALQDANTKYTPEGYQYRIVNSNGEGYYIEPGQGQFGDGGRGDNAFVYVTRAHTDRDEGDSDLVTIGPCCNDDYKQGPEKFIESPPESIVNTELVIWYVAQLKNDGAPGHEYCWADTVLENGEYAAKVSPCYAGPLFVPIRKQ